MTLHNIRTRYMQRKLQSYTQRRVGNNLKRFTLPGFLLFTKGHEHLLVSLLSCCRRAHTSILLDHCQYTIMQSHLREGKGGDYVAANIICTFLGR